MKKLLLVIMAVAAIGTSAYAQRPSSGTKAFTFGVNGLQNIGFNTNASRTGTLLFRQYLSDNSALRASANALVDIGSTSAEDKNNGVKQTTSRNNFGLAVGVGYQKSLGTLTRLEPYAGVDFTLGFNTGKTTNKREITDATKNPGSQQGDFTETEVRSTSPFNFGIIPLMGANYYITDGLAVGAEFSYGLVASFAGSGKTIDRKRTNGVNADDVETITTPSSMNFGLRNLGTTSVTFTVLF